MKKVVYVFLSIISVMCIIISMTTVSFAIDDTDMNSAKSINVNTNVSGHIERNCTDPQYNVYKFSVKNDGYIYFNIDFTKLVDSYEYLVIAQLFDVNGKMLYSNSKYIEKISSPKIGIASGTYYLKIFSVLNVNYTFSIKYTKASNWENEYNNNFSIAKPINVNLEYNGYSDYDDADCYKFSIPSNGAVSINFKHNYLDESSSGWDYSIYKLNDTYNKILCGSFNAKAENETSDSLGLPSGDYYLRIYSSMDESYSFTVNFDSSKIWERELNGNVSIANKIDLSTVCNGNCQTEDKDYYKFNIPATGYYTVNFNHKYLENGGWKISMNTYDGANEKSFAEYEVPGNSEKYNMPQIYLMPGDYYLKIADNGAGSQGADYSFKIINAQAAEGTTTMEAIVAATDVHMQETTAASNVDQTASDLQDTGGYTALTIVIIVLSVSALSVAGYFIYIKFFANK